MSVFKTGDLVEVTPRVWRGRVVRPQGNCADVSPGPGRHVVLVSDSDMRLIGADKPAAVAWRSAVARAHSLIDIANPGGDPVREARGILAKLLVADVEPAAGGFVVLVGNIVDGFAALGPYASSDAADLAGQDSDNGYAVLPLSPGGES